AGQDFHPPPDWDAGFEFRGGGYTHPGAEDHSAFFEDLFGHGYAAPGTGPRHTFRMRGEDHHAKVVIDLEDSYAGAARTITLRVPELTDDGHVTLRERTINLRIPRGIKPGQQIRLTEQGAPGLGGAKPGDLYLEVKFRDHPFYRVDGADVYLDLPVAPWEAALGAVVKVPTPSGVVDLKIPANSNQGRKLRLKGRGLPGKEPGNLYVVLQVSLPPADNDAAKGLYQQMADQLAFNPRANLGVS
ncbi:MAG: DnaJ C-terminal domain-containing protein, partial [Candidatus Competibacteraceae bacterium]|nr:DnaJ C-terminal domain-containing protein [Candidatus Competibacteraceae bacterium]